MKNRLCSLIVGLSCIASAWAGGPAVNDPWSGLLEREKTWALHRAEKLSEVPPAPAVPSPAGCTSQNEIDCFLADDWQKRGLKAAPLCSDAVFARRAYLDLIGLPPSDTQLQAFLSQSNSPDRRAKLVDALLADDINYAEHWITYWNDMLRNDEQTRSRDPITTWLYNALKDNEPYDLFVAELLDPRGPGAPNGYVKGIDKWAVAEASQSPPVQTAQNVAQVFMGTALKCASCHNSFVNAEWKLETFYGLASFFSPTNLEVVRCARPRGVFAPPTFIFPGMGAVSEQASMDQRLEAVSRMVTVPRNPRFAKSIVNRLWHKFIGQGFIDTVDNFRSDTPPSHPELLEWLARDLMDHAFDLKHTMKKIVLSRTYQSVRTTATPTTQPAKGERPAFVSPYLRRLDAEQMLDAISSVTGDWASTFKSGGQAGMGIPIPDGHIRAWRQKGPDELVVALGRPVVRDQVTTIRPTDASVLQSLELLNGQTLAERLHEGAAIVLRSPIAGLEPDDALDILYLRAIARKPTITERAALVPALGKPGVDPSDRRGGWEDVLWCLFVSPEFQYIQ